MRVDSDVVTNLIPKADKAAVDLSDTRRNILTTMFDSQLPEVDTRVSSSSSRPWGPQPLRW